MKVKFLTGEIRNVDITRGANLHGADLLGADLSSEDLRGADLRGAILYRADLREAKLRRADLRGADLRRSDLRRADLSGTNLSETDLRYADLRWADLSDIDLGETNLSDADLRWANLCNSSLSGAILAGANTHGVVVNSETTGYHNIIPPGVQLVYKKAGGNIVTLELFADSKRSNATTRKCRVSKALVKEISGGRTEVHSDYDDNFVYRVGEVVEVTNFDEDRWNECAPGIHCFLTAEEIEDW